MDDRALEELRALEARDADLRERASRLREIDDEVAGLRDRAEALDVFLATYPAELGRLRAEAAAAEAEVERHRAEAARARAAVQDAADDVARELAQRAAERAVDHATVAEAALARMREGLAQLERQVEDAPGRLAELRVRAERAHAAAPETPAPERASNLVDWASHAHAELFVAVGQIDAQRDRVIREANELASMLLGEPTYGSTVAQARARVEAKG